MAQILWSQDFFAKGELSPLMYSRVTLNAYYQGLKTAKNVLCFPQGSAGKRFGTVYLNYLTATNSYKHVYFKSFQYLNECCYLVIFTHDTISIYLEGDLTHIITGTGILADEVRLIDHTILEDNFVVTTGIYPPKRLRRSPNGPDPIVGFTPTTLSFSIPVTSDDIYPARFTTTGSLPVTTPQIHLNKTYFVYTETTTSVRLYPTAQDAKAGTNAFAIASAGVLSNLIIMNTWTFENIPFDNKPVFDFTGGYDLITFTPAALIGYNQTITMSGPMTGLGAMTPAYVGGVFAGNDGLARIISVTDATHFQVNIIQPFSSLEPIPGSLTLLAEPAWSDIRGWPRKCSSFQNRAFFANTELLSNGLWGSAVNQFNDFDDIDSLNDDSAISWYPTSDSVNYIQFIVPYRSLTIHTNSGVYSTPLSIETAITPKNFSLSLQDSTPAQTVQPSGIDNQIIVLSGNDAHSLLWDGFNNAYTSNIVSIANEQLIRNPIDEASYVDLERAGSKYMFIINDDGTMAIYQSLISENVSGFTPAVLEQSYGKAYFRWVTSNFDGRAWFLTEREFASYGAFIPLTGNTSNTLTAVGSNYPTTTFTAVTFTAGIPPTTSPQVVSDLVFYWAVGVTADTFKIYLNQEDATNDVNEILITNFGTGASIVASILTTSLLIEQLSFESYVDCAGFYSGPPTSTITTPIGVNYHAQEIVMQGDGYGFEELVRTNIIEFEAHGEPVLISEAQYGFPIHVQIEPLPLSISMTGNAKSSNLLDTKHLRYATFLFADTIGGFIENDGNSVPITMRTLLETPPGAPPVPITGSFEMSLFGGWNDFTYNSFTINHSEPFDIKLTGIFYKVDA